MKNSKALIIVVTILIVFNCLILSFLWLKVYQKPQQRPPIQSPAFEYLTQQLQLTPAQQQQYTKMRVAHRQLVDSLNEQSHLMRDSFFAKLKDTAARTTDITALSKRIAANTQQVDTSTFFHFQRFRKILTPAQQQKFDDIIQDVLRAGGRPPGPNGQGMPPQSGQPNDRMPPNRPRGRGPRFGPHPFGPPPAGRDSADRMPTNGRGPRPGMPPPNGGPPPYGPPPGGPPPYGPPPGQGPPPQK